VCKGALVLKLAITLDEPRACFLLTWLWDDMGEGARGACRTGADFEEFAGDMGEIFCYE